VLYCADEAVDLLLRSGGSHHVEFKSVDGGSLLYWEGCLYPVPDSRNAIFKDTTLERKEKFVLHKFFNLVKEHIAATSVSADERGEDAAAAMISEEDLERPFVEFLNQHRLSSKMRA
jgi:RAB protein geranylgeranyltransferase component A